MRAFSLFKPYVAPGCWCKVNLLVIPKRAGKNDQGARPACKLTLLSSLFGVPGGREVLMSNVYTQEALINLLEAKGIIKKAELFEEIKRIRGRKKG